MYSRLLSTTGVNRKAGADPRNSKTTAMRTCLKHLKIKTTTIRIHTLIGKAEEGTGEGGRKERGLGRGGDSLNSQGPSRSLNPPHMVVPCVQDLECHDNVDPIRLRDIDNFILKLFNSLHMFCLKQLTMARDCCRRIRLRSTE